LPRDVRINSRPSWLCDRPSRLGRGAWDKPAPQEFGGDNDTHAQEQERLPPLHPLMEQKYETDYDGDSPDSGQTDQKCLDVEPIKQNLCGADYICLDEGGLRRDYPLDVRQNADGQLRQLSLARLLFGR